MEAAYIVFDLGSTLLRTPPAAERHSRRQSYFESLYSKLVSLRFPAEFPLFSSLSPSEFAAGLSSHIARLKNLTEDWTLKDSILQYLHEVRDRLTGERTDILRMCRLSVTIEDAVSDETLIDVSGYELWPDTISTLQTLKSLGNRLAVYINTSSPPKAHKILRTTGLTPLFDYIFISSEAQVQFPSREVNTVVLNTLGIAENTLIYVGDMLDRTIKTAQQAGIKAVWLNLSPSNEGRNKTALETGLVTYPRTVTSLSLLPSAIQHYTPGVSSVKVGFFLPKGKKRLLMGKKHCFQSTAEVWYNSIDLLLDLSLQGDYQVVVHKALDLYTNLHSDAQQAVAAFHGYVHSHPHTCFLDSLQGMEVCKDRTLFLARVQAPLAALQPYRVRTPWLFHIPTVAPGCVSLAVDSMRAAGVQFPVIVKTFVSASTQTAHLMYVAFDEPGLETAVSVYSEGVMVQEYVNHDATVYKAYVFGDYLSVATRESSGNLAGEPGRHCVKFYTNEPWPESLKSTTKPVVKPIQLERFSAITEIIKEKFGLSLFGYDVLIPTGTEDMVLIDLNYFPGYKEIPDLAGMMDEHVQKSWARFQASSDT